MGCPCFITDYIGFCRETDRMYIPSIAEMEEFCFTRNFVACELFKNREDATESRVSEYPGLSAHRVVQG